MEFQIDEKDKLISQIENKFNEQAQEIERLSGAFLILAKTFFAKKADPRGAFLLLAKGNLLKDCRVEVLKDLANKEGGLNYEAGGLMKDCRVEARNDFVNKENVQNYMAGDIGTVFEMYMEKGEEEHKIKWDRTGRVTNIDTKSFLKHYEVLV